MCVFAVSPCVWACMGVYTCVLIADKRQLAAVVADDSDRDCPNCLPQSAADSGGGGGGSTGSAAVQRPPAAPAPSIDEFEFYPGTGADDVMEKNIVNAPLMPLWKYESSTTYLPFSCSYLLPLPCRRYYLGTGSSTISNSTHAATHAGV
jgi:hypothetical protein